MILVALLGLLLPVPLLAADEPAEDDAQASDDANAAEVPDKPDKRNPLPENAAAALVRATAAYEYGDMNQVVEAARPVAEGLLPASPYEQAQAFRMLGMGLYLTNRPMGAETAFTELLRKDPSARLDPTTTRPELVAFFENIRRRELTRQRRLIWNFIPPVGQFQNEESTKGWIILSVGVASLATAGTTSYLLNKWEVNPGYQQLGHEGTAPTLKAVNWIATGLLAATYVYGVFDGLIGYSRPLEDSPPSVAFKVFPEGGIGFAF
jgi:hypothetical protein